MNTGPVTPSKFQEKTNFLRNNIFDLVDVYGEPNNAHYQAVKKLDSILQAYPWFSGIVCFGSSFFGYSNETSDIDMYVLINDSTVDRSVISEAIREVEISHNVKFHSMRVCCFDPKLPTSFMNESHYKADDVIVLSMYWSSQGGSDGRLNKVKQSLRDKIGRLSKRQKQRIKEDVLSVVYEQDNARFGYKFTNRTDSDFGVADQRLLQEMLESRRVMWQSRFNDIYGY